MSLDITDDEIRRYLRQKSEKEILIEIAVLLNRIECNTNKL